MVGLSFIGQPNIFRYFFSPISWYLLITDLWGLRHYLVSGDSPEGQVMVSCTVWYCLVQSGTVWYCLVLPGTAWYCLVLSGTAWYCLVLPGTAWYCLPLLLNFFSPLFSHSWWRPVLPSLGFPGLSTQEGKTTEMDQIWRRKNLIPLIYFGVNHKKILKYTRIWRRKKLVY